MFLNLVGVWPTYKKEIKSAIKIALVEFPEIEQQIKTVKIGFLSDKRFATNTFYWKKALQHIIKLNVLAFSIPCIKKKFEITRQSGISNMFSIQDIIFHEIGHIFYNNRLCKYYGLDLYNKKSNSFKLLKNINNNNTIQLQLLTEIKQQFSISEHDFIVKFGSYSLEPGELVPECISNYLRLKNKCCLTNLDFEVLKISRYVIEYCKQL